MKTLKEINAERDTIINEAVKTLYCNPRLERGVPLTAKELSDLTDGIIPAENFESAMCAGYREVADHTYKRWCGGVYHLYNRIECLLVEDGRKFTYKVYDEDGKLVDEFTKDKRIIKAKIL